MAAGPLTIVIKVGTSSLVRIEKRSINISALSLLCETVRNLKEQGHRVVVVSSGAVGVGCQRMGLDSRPTNLAKRQALAAAGQVHLMRYYDDFFSAIGIVMLTLDNLAARNQYTNTVSTFQELFEYGIVPVVNENDTVAVEELHFGDNDTLSAKVATAVRADWLFLLTDVDALYTANPSLDPTARPIREVHDIAQLQVETGTRGTEWGTGGMATKLTAAAIATAAGCNAVVCSAAQPGSIERILAGEALGTVFHHHPRALKGRKRWILMVPAKGQLWLDAGAVAAVRGAAKSLFPAGVVRCVGEFGAQDAVQLCDAAGVPFAQGLSNYAHTDVAQLQGRQSQDIRGALGFVGSEELVHRDNIALLTLRHPPPDATTPAPPWPPGAPGVPAAASPPDADSDGPEGSAPGAAAIAAATAAAAAGGAAALAAGAASGDDLPAEELTDAWAAPVSPRSDSVTSLTRPSLVVGSERPPPLQVGRTRTPAAEDSPNPLPSPASGFRSRLPPPPPLQTAASRDTTAAAASTPQPQPQQPLPDELQVLADPAVASAALLSSQGPIREATEAEIAARRAIIAAAKSGKRPEDVTSPRTESLEASSAAAPASAPVASPVAAPTAAPVAASLALPAAAAAGAAAVGGIARADSGRALPPSPGHASPGASPRTSPEAGAPENFRPMSTARSSSALLLSRPSARRAAQAQPTQPPRVQEPARPRHSLDGQTMAAEPVVASAVEADTGLKSSLRRSGSSAENGQALAAGTDAAVAERLEVLRQREASGGKRVSFEPDSWLSELQAAIAEEHVGQPPVAQAAGEGPDVTEDGWLPS